TRIVISEFTHQQVKERFVCRPLDLVRVKGKLHPVRIYELISEGPAPEEMREFLMAYSEAHTFYLDKQFSKALSLFEKAQTLSPEDQTTQIYIERCRNYTQLPPPQDWD